MSGRIGILGAVGLALESSWGQPASPTRYLEVSYADLRPVIAHYIPDTVRGTRGRKSVRRGPMLCSGAVSLEVCAGAVGEVLKAAFGTVTTTLVASAGTSAIYEHTFTRCDTTCLPSLTMEQNMGGLTSRRVAGVRVNQLSLGLARGRTLTADVDCRGREQTLVSPSTPSYQPDEPLPYHGLTAEVGGAEAPEVEEFLVRFNNGLVDDLWSAGGEGKLSKLPAGAFSVGGRLATAFESTAAQEAFVNGEPTALRLRTSGASVVGTWGYALEIELPKVRYFSVRSPLTAGRLTYDIAFEALLDAAEQPPVEARCRLWNTTAGY
jgi:hypothetical protein